MSSGGEASACIAGKAKVLARMKRTDTKLMIPFFMIIPLMRNSFLSVSLPLWVLFGGLANYRLFLYTLLV